MSSNDPRSTKSPPPKPQRSPSLNSPLYANTATANRMQDFPPHSINQHQRFSLTPHNLGMDIRPYQQQPPQHSRSTGDFQSQMYDAAKEEFQQLPRDSSSSPAAGIVIKHESSEPHITDQSSNNINRRTSAPPPLSPTTRFPLSASSSIFSTQQTIMPSSHVTTITAMSPPTTPTNDRQCTHAQHARTSLQENPTAYYEQQVQKFRSGSDLYTGDSAKINAELNGVFLKRLQDIDENGQGDTNVSC